VGPPVVRSPVRADRLLNPSIALTKSSGRLAGAGRTLPC
jgi:hypothetical protein